MASALLLLGCAIVVGTALLTAARYADLPERIPIHFGLSGTADSYGPRGAAWLVVGVQLLFLSTYLLLREARVPLAPLLLADVVLACLAWIQAQIIALAIGGGNRISPWRMWSMAAVIVLAAVVSARFAH